MLPQAVPRVMSSRVALNVVCLAAGFVLGVLFEHKASACASEVLQREDHEDGAAPDIDMPFMPFRDQMASHGNKRG